MYELLPIVSFCLLQGSILSFCFIFCRIDLSNGEVMREVMREKIKKEKIGRRWLLAGTA